MSYPHPPLIYRAQTASDWSNGAMVSEGEAVFGHICHEERRSELVMHPLPSSPSKTCGLLKSQ